MPSGVSEHDDGGRVLEWRRALRRHRQLRRPARTRRGREAWQRGQRLAIGAAGIEEPAAIEVIALHR
jgi:hypothetical protein